jgi:hypothetical protein
MQQIIEEGNSIGALNSSDIKINVLYAKAEEYLSKGNRMYEIGQLLETFVYYLKLTRINELICKHSNFECNRRYFNIKSNIYRTVGILEDIKPTLLKKYGSGIGIEQEKNSSDKKISIDSYSDHDRFIMLNNLEAGWARLNIAPSKKIPNTEQPQVSNSLKSININNNTKTTDDINKYNYNLNYYNNGNPLDALTILSMHLKVYNRIMVDVPGDNNCQFHAIVDQLDRICIKNWTAMKLRKKAVKWLRDNEKREMDDGKLGEKTLLRDAMGIFDWDKYIREMLQHDVTWGDEATLLALSVLFKLEIIIISSLPGNYAHSVKAPIFWNIEALNKIYLGHYHEFHYVSTQLI